MPLAAKEETLSPSSDPCVFFPLAADPAELETRFGETSQLRKKSHQGFARKNVAPHQGSAWTNSGTALGIEPLLRREGIRSRCTGKERDAESGNDYFGARYYASSMGRFLSPDWSAKVQPVPYAKLDDPQSLNLYSYVRNNPLSRVDKDGHCSSPSVGKGQVGVCIDLYIQAKTINLVGQGDGRGPAANDPKATYRVELQLVMDPKAGTVSLVKDDAGVSKALGGLISNKGTDTTSPITPTTDANGTTHFTINNTALNGLHDLPGAPQDTIKTTINMDVTSGGKVGIEGGERTAYPSLEIYSYSPSGQSTSILQMQEHNPSDLAKQNQQIPQVAPQ